MIGCHADIRQTVLEFEDREGYFGIDGESFRGEEAIVLCLLLALGVCCAS